MDAMIKKESTTKNKGGRPPKQIDESLVTKLAKINCTMAEIAAVVGCSVDTLERRFAEVIKKGQEEGKSSLRRLQWLQAEKGNANMLIWLGKQWLGQRDRPADEVSSVTFNVHIEDVPKCSK